MLCDQSVDGVIDDMDYELVLFHKIHISANYISARKRNRGGWYASQLVDNKNHVMALYVKSRNTKNCVNKLDYIPPEIYKKAI